MPCFPFTASGRETVSQGGQTCQQCARFRFSSLTSTPLRVLGKIMGGGEDGRGRSSCVGRRARLLFAV
eukprot:627162-Heterocapsa_arctica.AAC.1